MLQLVVTALLLGTMHSFAPDHLAAVSVFVSRRPSWRHALGLGARWGVGHSLTIVAVGAALVLSGLELPARFAPLAERLVGVTLVGLGIFALVRALRVHGHLHTHADGSRHWHVHSHLRQPEHDHDHRALLGIGMLHGLAGSGALVVTLPLLRAGARPTALWTLLAFGIGTICSMALFGALAGWLMTVTTRTSARVERGLRSLAGLASVGVGVWWLVSGGA